MSGFKSRLLGGVKLHGPPLAIIVALTAVMCRNLILSTAFPGGWDVVSVLYPLTYFGKTDSYFNLWEDNGLGYVTPISLFHLLSFVADLVGDPALIARSVLIFSVLGAGLLMYLYVYLATRRRLASLASAIIFSTSQGLASHVACGHGFLVLMYSLLPLLFLLVDHGLRQANLAYMLGLGVVLSLLPSLRFDPVAYATPFLMLFLFWHVVVARQGWRRAAMNAVRLFLPAVILGGLLSAYVWLPLLKTGSAHATRHFSVSAITSTSLDFWPTIRGQGLIYSYIFWKGGTSLYTHQFLPPLIYELVMLLTPALAFVQVRLRGDRRAGFFLATAIISLFLAKGPHPALGEVYLFLWRYVPFINQLHVPNRWLMVTWLAYAFLAGLTLDRTYRVVKAGFEARGRRNLTQLTSGMAVVLLLLGSTVGISYVFTDGYQTWSAPQEEVVPHKWLAENGERGRFMPVPYGHKRMFVQGGWLEHNLGTVGGMFSGRPSFKESYFEDYSDDFFTYTGMLVSQKADKLVKIAGAYDVRYVVTQGYSSSASMRSTLLYTDVPPIEIKQDYSQHDYFDRLEGLRKVFEGPDPEYTLLVGEKDERQLTLLGEEPRLWPLQPQRRSAIYENEHWMPRLFIPRKQMLIVGGLESLKTLAEFDEFSFQDWDLRFASRTLNELGQEGLIRALHTTDLLVFVNSELLDLAEMIANSTRVDFAPVTHDPEAQWFLTSYPSYLTEDRNILKTKENHAQITLPVYLSDESQAQDYEVWVRVFYGPQAGVINFAVDGEEVGSLLPRARNWMGFAWQKVGTVVLRSGPHKVSITALATDPRIEVRLDEIALLRVGAIDEATNLISEIMRDADLKIISLQDSSRLWQPSQTSTQLSRYRLLEIALQHPKKAGIERVLFAGEREAPPFDRSGSFVIIPKPIDGHTPLLEIDFKEPQNWHPYTYMRFDFRGVNSGKMFRLQITFANSGSATYYFHDRSSTWQTVYIPLFYPDTIEGTLQWDKVSSLTIDIPEVELRKAIGFGPFALLEDRLSLQHLGTALGMKTFLLSKSESSPPSAAAFLSVTTPQPARIIEWEQVSPSLYHLRVAAKAPYNLVLSNAYHPLWRAIIDGREINPQPTYYSVNAHAIDKIGEYDLTLEFIGQRYQRFAFAVSMVAYSVVGASLLGCLLWSWAKRRQTTQGHEQHSES